MRYCLIEASKLFEAIKTQMEGGDTSAFLNAITHTEGAYSDPIDDATLATPAQE
jgi:hypothetical protein